MARSSRWTFLVGLAVIIALSASPRAEGQLHLLPNGYENAKTLKDAIKVLKTKLTKDGKPEYAALLTEDRVRDAIRTAIKGYEAMPAIDGKPPLGTDDYWTKEVKPLCLKIADKKEWPPGCAFGGSYGLTTSHGIFCDGLGLRLYVATPNGRHERFDLSIMDLYFGKISE